MTRTEMLTSSYENYERKLRAAIYGYANAKTTKTEIRHQETIRNILKEFDWVLSDKSFKALKSFTSFDACEYLVTEWFHGKSGFGKNVDLLEGLDDEEEETNE